MSKLRKTTVVNLSCANIKYNHIIISTSAFSYLWVAAYTYCPACLKAFAYQGLDKTRVLSDCI